MPLKHSRDISMINKKFFEWKFLQSSIALIIGWLMVGGWFARLVSLMQPDANSVITEETRMLARLNLWGGGFIFS